MISRMLDSGVRHAHGWTFGGRKLHPYLVCFDLGLGLGLAVGLAFAWRSGELDPVRWAATFVFEVLAYQALFLPLKRSLGISSRSFLQDTLFFLLPLYGLLCWVSSQPIGASLDAVGLMLPMVLAFARLGCFFGGCCYGTPMPWGVYYPPELLVEVRGCQDYTPGPAPEGRVLPLQLLEALVNLGLFLLLAVRLAQGAALDGSTAILYLASYGTWRFAAEFLRGARHRPRWGRLSQAQWLAMGLVLAGAAWWALV